MKAWGHEFCDPCPAFAQDQKAAATLPETFGPDRTPLGMGDEFWPVAPRHVEGLPGKDSAHSLSKVWEDRCGQLVFPGPEEIGLDDEDEGVLPQLCGHLYGPGRCVSSLSLDQRRDVSNHRLVVALSFGLMRTFPHSRFPGSTLKSGGFGLDGVRIDLDP